jgi:hypothetical protein
MDKNNKKLTAEEFIQRAKKIHGDKYDYSLVEYKNMNSKVILICDKHGEFPIFPNNHIHKKCGCDKCRDTYKSTTKKFIEKARKIHGNKYDYSLVNYKNNRFVVEIICPVHGSFELTPNKHLDRIDGCPKCNRTSKGENIIKWWLDNNNIQYETQKRFEDCKDKRTLPFDFYIPSKNMCIEYDGIQHFEIRERFGGIDGFVDRKRKDKIKNNYCKNNNIKLIRISYKEDIVKKIIDNIK